MTTDCPPGCPEFRSTSLRRRDLLGAAMLGATTAVFGDTFVQTNYAHAAAPGSRPNVVVVVSLRGAADGLSMVVPHHEAAYYAARPTIAVPAAQLLGADAWFGLHPAMAPLMPLWTEGRFAVVNATGLTARNRSHFSAMEELEDADPGSSLRSGWLNRLVGRDGTDTTLDAVSYAGAVPSTLVTGEAAVFSAASLDDAKLAGPSAAASSARRRAALVEAWQGTQSPLADGMLDALDTVDRLGPARDQAKAEYPSSDLAKALRDAARTIKADIGAEAITVDTASWDFHASMGTVAGGSQTRRTTQLAEALAAFFADLAGEAERVTVVTISEFGRRVQENASRGTDHGHGNVILLLGAGVRGGQYHGRWPGLQNAPDADVAVTTDYRHVLHEVITSRFGSAAGVFPGFGAQHLGVMMP